MSKRIDMTGQRFGMLTVLRPSDQKKGYWVCQCDCGTIKECHPSNLRSGNTRSCGCSMKTRIDLTGERFGKLTVLRESAQQEGMWLCQCDCGKTTEVSTNNLRRGHTKSCGCLRGRHKEDLTGQRFSNWTVLQESEQKKSHWVCQCDCGTIKELSASNLRRGTTKSCGCIRKVDLTGQRFGMLTVLRESERQKYNWICQCDCGIIKEFSTQRLSSGLITSCGCVPMKEIDLTGQKIGKLTVLNKSEQRENYWICQCDCGNTIEVSTGKLSTGHKKSCGCSVRTKLDLTGQRFNKLVVLHESETRKGYWVCQCDCGNITEVVTKSLRSNMTKSCGCLISDKKEDLTGQRFGMLTVLHESEQRKYYWLCQCDCGNTKEIYGRSLRSGSTKSCGCMRKVDLAGQRFGKLTVLSKAENKSTSNRSYWICLCDCGNTTVVSNSNLQSGATKSCGCISGGKIEMESGQRFGHWTVLQEADQKGGYWLCKCDCGNIKEVLGVSLRRGLTKSCGCKDGIFVDLTGQKFGLLTVLKQSETQTSFWVCQCDCGNTIELHESKLQTGHTKSCGCLKKIDMTGKHIGRLTVLRESETRKGYWVCQCDCGKTKTILGSTIRQGTALSCGCLLTESIERKKQTIAELKTNPDRIRDCSKLQKNNTSGIRGVYYSKSQGVYIACIGFQGVKYTLKRSTDINVCAAARKEAEEALFGNFLEWYDKEYGESMISDERKAFVEEKEAKKKKTDDDINE